MDNTQNTDVLIVHTAKVSELMTLVATETNHSKRLGYIAELICVNILGDYDAIALFRRGSTVVSYSSQLSDEQVTDLASASYSDQFCIITLDKRLELVIRTGQPVPDDQRSNIGEYLARFDLIKRPPYWLFAALIALVILLSIPVRESMNTTATVIGDGGITITAPNAGIVSSVDIRVGQVTDGQTIATLDNNALIDARSAEAHVKAVNAQIQAEGLNPTTNLSVLYLELEKANAQMDRAIADASRNSIHAPQSGLISWKPELAGTWVEKGQVLGIVHPKHQTNAQALINHSDWIGASIGDYATFSPDDGSDRIAGQLASIPSEPIQTAAGIQYQIDVRLDKPLPTGLSGRLVVVGDKATILTWLIRKPLYHFKAWFQTAVL